MIYSISILLKIEYDKNNFQNSYKHNFEHHKQTICMALSLFSSNDSNTTRYTLCCMISTFSLLTSVLHELIKSTISLLMNHRGYIKKIHKTMYILTDIVSYITIYSRLRKKSLFGIDLMILELQ